MRPREYDTTAGRTDDRQLFDSRPDVSAGWRAEYRAQGVAPDVEPAGYENTTDEPVAGVVMHPNAGGGPEVVVV